MGRGARPRRTSSPADSPARLASFGTRAASGPRRPAREPELPASPAWRRASLRTPSRPPRRPPRPMPRDPRRSCRAARAASRPSSPPAASAPHASERRPPRPGPRQPPSPRRFPPAVSPSRSRQRRRSPDALLPQATTRRLTGTRRVLIAGGPSGLRLAGGGVGRPVGAASRPAVSQSLSSAIRRRRVARSRRRLCGLWPARPRMSTWRARRRHDARRTARRARRPSRRRSRRRPAAGDDGRAAARLTPRAAGNGRSGAPTTGDYRFRLSVSIRISSETVIVLELA